MEDLVAWIQRLFEDCAFGAPHGVGWWLDRAEPPITATVTPADRDTGRIVLAREDVLARLSFVSHLQTFLDLEFDAPLPACPHHHTGLTVFRAGDTVHWRCDAGDFECAVGEYQEALWPPNPDDPPPRGITPMLARRFSRRGVDGMSSFSVQNRGGRLVATIKVRPGADLAAIRAAADPIAVETEEVEAIRTVRVQRPATETEPAHRALTRIGAAMRLAALHGTLRRARDDDPADFVVGDVLVRLAPEHRLGPPSGPLVLDASGESFSDEGDSVCCVGGFAPDGPVRGGPRVFYAGELRVYDRPATLRTS